jgi:hypothetical protein
MSYTGMTQTAPKAGLRFRHVVLMVFIAFVGGGVAMWWLANEYGYLDSVSLPVPPPAISVSSPLPADITAPLPGNRAPALPPATPGGGTDSHLAQINTDAASGNAARAESLLVAFAARRAIDGGAPLGYLVDQLRLRFGSSQPQAVSTVIAASQVPVTIDMLKAELTGLEPALLTGSSDAGIWTTVKREMSELFVLRKDSAPLPVPVQRMERAQTLVESGNMAAAMVEVSAMPGASAAQSWLVRAKRYSDARKALDRLERSVLVAPVSAPVPQSAVQGMAPEPLSGETAQP